MQLQNEERYVFHVLPWQEDSRSRLFLGTSDRKASKVAWWYVAIAFLDLGSAKEQCDKSIWDYNSLNLIFRFPKKGYT